MVLVESVLYGRIGCELAKAGGSGVVLRGGVFKDKGGRNNGAGGRDFENSSGDGE